MNPAGPMPIFEIGPLEPRYSEWLVFEGVSVDESGKQHYLDTRWGQGAGGQRAATATCPDETCTSVFTSLLLT